MVAKANESETQRQRELQDARDQVKQAQKALKAAGAAKKAGVDISAVVPPLSKFDGSWRIIRLSEECKKKKLDFIVSIKNGVVRSDYGSGNTSPGGEFSYSAQPRDGGSVTYSGKITGATGTGNAIFRRPERAFSCSGTFTITKLD